MTDYVIEMDDRDEDKYATIHKVGCQHVKDPMPIDNDDPDDATGWGMTADEYHRAPCVNTLPLDPEPWECQPWGSDFVLRHARCHEGYVDWNPRPGYAQDEDDYPEEFFEEGD